MLQSRLISIMQRELQSQNLQLSPYCTQQIEQLVGQGLKRMQINSGGDHAGRALTAERNLRLLVRYFSEYARESGTFPLLNNSDFDIALNVCPSFWPYRS